MAFAAGNKLLASELNALPQVVDIAKTVTDGTISSGTTDTLDAIMGTIQIVADGNTNYEISLRNAFIAASGSGVDHCLARIRDGGASTPTSASTEIALWPFQPNGVSSLGQEGAVLSVVVTPSAGTHTYGCFIQRSGGTSTNFNFIGTRQLVAETAGPA